MNIFGLFTSAGINIGLAALFLMLYSIFSKQPSNAGVYFGRDLLRDRKQKDRKERSLESFVPSVTWIVRAWRLTENEILDRAGLDALVFLRIFNFSTKLFAICSIIGVFILVPVDYTAKEVVDPSQFGNESFDRFTITNLQNGSKRWWIHFGAVYVISISCYLLTYFEYRNITNKRLTYLASVRPQPDQFSVLVRSIPKPPAGQSYSDLVQEFFTRYHPMTYLSHQMIYNAGKLEGMIRKFENLKEEITWLKRKDPRDRQPKRDGFCGLYGPMVDPGEKMTKKLEDLYQKIREAQQEILQKPKEIPATIVVFKTRWGATVAAQSQQAENPTTWVTEWAPEPRDVYWPNLSVSFSQLWFRQIIAGVVVFIVTILFVIPNTAVQAVSNIKHIQDFLEKYTPAGVEKILDFPGVQQFIEGYLSTVLLAAILFLIPPFMLFISRLEGVSSKSIQERKASAKYFYFLAGPVFFINVLSASLFDEIEFLKEPARIPYRLASALPRQATFFMSYIMTTGWAGFPLEILQSGLLIFNMLKRHTVKEDSTQPELEVNSLPYYRVLPQLLLFIFVGLMYAAIAPVLPPFLLVYFALGYVIFKNQIMHVYEPAYETGGQFWPQVHNRIVAALFLMQITFIGIFQTRMSTLSSSLTVPLPIFTILYYQYCNKRFFPNFQTFSIESTMNKDADDEQRGLRREAIECIQDAYLHPALQPVDMSRHGKSHTDPLLP